MPSLTAEQEQIRAKIIKAARASATKHGIKDVNGFIKAMLTVGWGESSWTPGGSSGDGGVSHGIFQIGVNHGQGQPWYVKHTAEELKNPDINIPYAAEYLGVAFKKGEDQGLTSWQDQVYNLWGPNGQVSAVNDQTPDGEQVRANVKNSINTMAEMYQEPGASADKRVAMGGEPITAAAAPSTTDPYKPKLENYRYIVGTDLDGNPIYGDTYDVQTWRKDTEAYEGKSETNENPTLDYIDQQINQVLTDISGKNLKTTQAVEEFNRRYDAWKEAGTQMTNLMPYAVSPGRTTMPGYEPGGIASKLGLGERKFTPIEYNSFEMGNQIVRETPNIAEIGAPSLSGANPEDFQAAVEMLRQKGLGGNEATGAPAYTSTPVSTPGAVVPSADRTVAEAQANALPQDQKIINAIMSGMGVTWEKARELFQKTQAFRNQNPSIQFGG